MPALDPCAHVAPELNGPPQDLERLRNGLCQSCKTVLAPGALGTMPLAPIPAAPLRQLPQLPTQPRPLPSAASIRPAQYARGMGSPDEPLYRALT